MRNGQIARTTDCVYSDGLPLKNSVAYLPLSVRPSGLSYTVSLFLLVALAVDAANAETGSAACAVCHASIFSSLSCVLPMAASSGRTGSGSFAESFEKGEISHAPSGIRLPRLSRQKHAVVRFRSQRCQCTDSRDQVA